MVHWFIVNNFFFTTLVYKCIILDKYAKIVSKNATLCIIKNNVKTNHIRLTEMRLNMATDKPRYTVSVDNELFQQIEDFRFEHRYQTRSEATVELIRLGLETLKKEQKTSQNHNS